MDRSQVAVVIPAFNEAATISQIVSQVSAFGSAIVVDDHSSDNTAALASKAGAVTISHPTNLGYDAALNTGFAKASEMKCKYVVTIDADGQHCPQLITMFLRRLEEGCDVVVGVRSKKARISESIFSCYTRLLYGIQDPLCGFKAYNMQVYNRLGYFDSYNSIGTELMLASVSSGFTLEQVKFLAQDRVGSTPRFGSSLRANFKILRALLCAFIYTRK